MSNKEEYLQAEKLRICSILSKLDEIETSEGPSNKWYKEARKDDITNF